MHIASLDPALTDIIISLGIEAQLVAVTANCNLASDLVDVQVLPVSNSEDKKGLSLKGIALSELLDSNAEIVVARADAAVDKELVKTQLKEYLPEGAKLRVYQAISFDTVLEMIADLAADLGMAAQGQQLANRLKAQAMDWGANFYARTHNKKVSVIASLEPLALYGLWVPDMLNLASCHSQLPGSQQFLIPVEWRDIVAFKPDVIIVAPWDGDLNAALSLFKRLEKFPDWDDIPAVKRGEVVFAAGQGIFDRPSLALREALAILFSSIAGFDSGYITQRDTFHRLRWVELQRHRF